MIKTAINALSEIDTLLAQLKKTQQDAAENIMLGKCLDTKKEIRDIVQTWENVFRGLVEIVNTCLCGCDESIKISMVFIHDVLEPFNETLNMLNIAVMHSDYILLCDLFSDDMVFHANKLRNAIIKLKQLFNMGKAP